MQSNERTPRIRKLALNRDRFLLHRFLLAGKGILRNQLVTVIARNSVIDGSLAFDQNEYPTRDSASTGLSEDCVEILELHGFCGSLVGFGDRKKSYFLNEPGWRDQVLAAHGRVGLKVALVSFLRTGFLFLEEILF
jgi:hypothetical protein